MGGEGAKPGLDQPRGDRHTDSHLSSTRNQFGNDVELPRDKPRYMPTSEHERGKVFEKVPFQAEDVQGHLPADYRRQQALSVRRARALHDAHRRGDHSHCEEYGQVTADAVIPQIFPGAEKVFDGRGRAGQGEFDQIWRLQTRVAAEDQVRVEYDYVVVECKAPNAGRGHCKVEVIGAQGSGWQGSLSYYHEVVAKMCSSTRTILPHSSSVAGWGRLLAAKAPGGVYYCEVRPWIDANREVLGGRVALFDLDLPELAVRRDVGLGVVEGAAIDGPGHERSTINAILDRADRQLDSAVRHIDQHRRIEK